MATRFPNSVSRAAGLLTLLLVSAVMASLQGCTDLEETPVSAITPENFYRNEAEVIGGLASVYAELRGDGSLWAYYNLSEITTDEMIVPTRGQDWHDNGRWLEIHRQEWTANSTSGLDDINRVWVDSFRGVARANLLLEALQGVSVRDQEIVEAEVRGLRAFYYYLLMDMFGGVPIVTSTDIARRPRNTRAEVFEFIEDELLAVREILPPQWPSTMHGRLTRGAADAILASLYLNAEVFTGTVEMTGLQRGTPRWQDAIDAANRVLNSGVYMLAADFNVNFRHDNHLSPENIFVVKNLNADGLGLNFLMRSLHYNSLTGTSPWNGFSTLAETYYAFDADDRRREIFKVGPQVNLDTGQPITDRSGKPLVFVPEIENARRAGEGEGARIVKWTPDPNKVGWEHSNDVAYFRLAEMHLIKAEALNEQGSTMLAVEEVNKVRARAFNPQEPLDPAAFTQATFREQILRERLYELTAEAKRRQDLIRHGRFNMQRKMCSAVDGSGASIPDCIKTARPPYIILMPIPQSQLDTNPMLVQNPGY